MGTDKLQGYSIVDRLGDGALGALYRAREDGSGRPVALRILTGDIRWDDDLRSRLRRHCEAVSALDHPNIARLHAFGQERGTAFIATELVEGHDLREAIAGEAMPVERKVALMRQLADGLGYAHQAGILHFDLRPADILISPDGVLKVADLGLAHILVSALPRPIVVWAAPIYRAPEQIRDGSYDVRSEIFVAGMIWYELLTGAHPFGDGGERTVLDDIASESVLPDFEPLQDSVPGLCGILENCLAKDPRDRYESMSELAAACGDLLEDIGRECNAMLVELQVAMPRLKRAAGKLDAPSELVDLASRIQTLVASDRKRDYAALDRLMSAMAEQNEVIHALLGGEGKRRGLQDVMDPDPETADPAIAVAEEPLPVWEDFRATEEFPPSEDRAVVSAEPEPVRCGSAQCGLAEAFMDLDPHELDFLRVAGVDAPEEPGGSTAQTALPAQVEPVGEAIPPAPKTLVAEPPERDFHTRLAVRPAIWAAATAALVLVAALAFLLRSGFLAPGLPGRDRAGALPVGPNSGTAASPVPAGDAAADLLVRQATEVAAQGRIGEARLFLNRALEIDAEYAPARELRERLDADEVARRSVDGALRKRIADVVSLTAAGQLRRARTQIDAIAAAHPNHPALAGLRRDWEAKNAELTRLAERRKVEAAETVRRASADAEWARRSGDLFRTGRYAEAQRAAEQWLVENPASTQAESMRARAAEGRQLVNVIEPAIADRRYADATVALARLESVNPLDPAAPALRKTLEGKKAAARAMLSVYRLADAGALLFDGVAIGGAGEVETAPVAIGEHTLSVKPAAGGAALSLVHDFQDGEKAAFVYDGRSLRPMTGADNATLANRRLLEQVYRLPVEHGHGLLRGSCRGELLISGAEVRYQPASGRHGFRMPFSRLKLKVDGRSIELRYASDGVDFQSFRTPAPSDGEALQKTWLRLESASR